MDSGSKVFVVDDDPSVRRTLMVMLRGGGFDADAFANAEQWLAGYGGSQPQGCLLLEMGLPGMSGLELQQHLHQLDWTIPTIFLTRCGTIATAVAAMKAGAVTVLQKPANSDVLVRWVRAALALDRWLCGVRARKARAQACLDLLSAREQEVLRGIAAGKSNREIAGEMYLSGRTIETHRTRIMKKINAANLAELVVLATAAEIDPATAIAGARLDQALYQHFTDAAFPCLQRAA